MSRLLMVVSLLVASFHADLACALPSTLWIEAGYHAVRVASTAGSREVWAMLGLSLPWEQHLQPVRHGSRRGAKTGEPALRETAPATQTEGLPESSDGVGGSEEITGEASQVRSVPSSRPPSTARAEPRHAMVLTPALARETLRRALKSKGIGRATARLSSLASRSRWSGVLPDLSLRAVRGTDQSLRFVPTIADPYRYTRDGGSDLTLEGRVSWHLSKLLFTPSEIAIERLRQAREQRQRQLSLSVLNQLVDWQQARLRADDEAALPEERQAAELSALRAELTLHMLTDGWFSTTRAEGYVRAHRVERPR